MAAEDIIYVNGKAFSHASVSVFIGDDPVPYRGIKSINYRHGLDPGEFKGTNAQVTRVTLGDYTAGGDMELRKDEHQRMLRFLGNGWMAVRVPITVIFQSAGMTTEIDQLLGVGFTESSLGSSEGKEATTKKVNLHIMMLLEDGIAPIPDMVFV